MTDIRFTAGLDDTQFVRGITNLETQTRRAAGPVNSAFGGWGSSIESSTAGLRKMQTAITGTIGMATGALGTIGLITGAVAGVVALYQRMEQQQALGTKQLHEQERQQRGIFQSLERELNLRRELLGLRTTAESSEAAIRDDAQGVRDRAREEMKLNDLLAQQLKLEDEISKRSEFASARRQRDLNPAGSRLAQAENELESVRASIRAFDSQLSELARLEGALVAQQRQRAQDEGATQALRSQVDLFRAQGREVEGLRLAERIAHAERVARIDQLASAGAGNIDDLRTLETDLHNARLDRIQQESQAREAAALQRERSERLSLERERDRQRFGEGALDIELLRLRGMEREAAQRQIILDIERQRRELELDPSRSEADRQRLRLKLQEIETLRLADLDGRSDPSQSRTRTLGLGLIGGASLARQTFGTGDAVTAQQLVAQKSISDSARRTLDVLQGLVEGNALRVEGNFGARLN